jgi:hypothetical protein
LQSDCKESGLEQRQIQNGSREAKLLLFLVNLCAQEGVSAFQQKQFEHFLQPESALLLDATSAEPGIQ